MTADELAARSGAGSAPRGVTRWIRGPIRRPRIRPLVLGELVVVAVLLFVYDQIKDLAPHQGNSALHHALDVVHSEKDLHLFVELHLDNFAARYHWLSLTVSYFYQFVHIPVTMAVLVICYWRWPIRYRFARNTLVLTNVIGLTTFVLYPVMPPRLLPGYGFHDAVAAAGFGTTHVGGPVPEAQYAAMPSLHLAWATWVMILVFGAVSSWRLRALVVAYPVLMFLVVMATGNHYFFDGLAGILTTLASGAAAWAWERRVRPETARVAILPAHAAVPVHADNPV
jgi:hypothetical protein